MKDGIYESIINEELSRNLDSDKYYIKTEKLKGKDSKNIIVNYLSEVTQRALNTINEVDVDKDDDEIIIEEIRICNELIELLRSKLPFDEYRELNISENAEILEYAYNKVNNPLFDGKIIKPVTSLTEPTLFTNSSKEITPTLSSNVLVTDLNSSKFSRRISASKVCSFLSSCLIPDLSSTISINSVNV